MSLHVVLTGGLATELPVAHILSDSPEVSELGDRKHITTFRAGAREQHILSVDISVHTCDQ